MRTKIICIALLVPICAFSRQKLLKDPAAGNFSLGMRSAISTFNHGQAGDVGLGYGGQFRLQFSDRVNSEWFTDYIQSNIGDVAERQDFHVGWSVMYYLIPTKDFNRLFTPYAIAGNCFDHTKLVDNKQILESKDRWSAAVQAGIGTHINLTPRFDITATAQYMIHIGDHLEAHYGGDHSHTTESTHTHHPDGLSFEKHKGGGVEGHLLFNIGINYKIADLW